MTGCGTPNLVAMPLPPHVVRWADAPPLRCGLSPGLHAKISHGPSVFLFVAAFELPLRRPGLLEDSTTMHLTATNQTKRYRALWRVLAFLLTVVGFIASSTRTASALSLSSTASSSGQSRVVGPETRVGVTTHFSGGSSTRLTSESPGCVGENIAGYDGFVSASCVATKSVGNVAAEGDHIVLGLKNQGLEATAGKVGGRTLLKDPAWQDTLRSAVADPSTKFTVSLDGLSGSSPYSQVMSGAQRGLGGAGSYTDWELAQLYQGGRLGDVTFVKGGVPVPNPFKP